MRNLSAKELDSNNGRELNDFETLALPLLERLYRMALILTKSPGDAKGLIQETFSNAKQKYHRLGPGTHFGAWLCQLLISNYVTKYGKFESRDSKTFLGGKSLCRIL